MTYHDLPRALLAHLGFTAVSVFFGFVLGVAFGILLSGPACPAWCCRY